MFDVFGEILYLEKVQQRSFWIPFGYVVALVLIHFQITTSSSG